MYLKERAPKSNKQNRILILVCIQKPPKSVKNSEMALLKGLFQKGNEKLKTQEVPKTKDYKTFGTPTVLLYSFLLE